ncbi:MAG: hypothetical protein EBR82_80025 [Caulobacteraceae bacterium]|nr:hypothetical protein [Caulobacteraceae bacterium]
MKLSKHNKKITDFIETAYSDYSDKILLADGFDDAFIGIAENSNGKPVAVYSIDKCLSLLEKQFEDQEDAYGDAVDYFEFNVRGAYIGEFTPIFVNTLLV